MHDLQFIQKRALGSRLLTGSAERSTSLSRDIPWGNSLVATEGKTILDALVCLCRWGAPSLGGGALVHEVPSELRTHQDTHWEIWIKPALPWASSALSTGNFRDSCPFPIQGPPIRTVSGIEKLQGSPRPKVQELFLTKDTRGLFLCLTESFPPSPTVPGHLLCAGRSGCTDTLRDGPPRAFPECLLCAGEAGGGRAPGLDSWCLSGGAQLKPCSQPVTPRTELMAEAELC